MTRPHFLHRRLALGALLTVAALNSGCWLGGVELDVEQRGGVVCTLGQVSETCTFTSPNHEIVGAIVNRSRDDVVLDRLEATSTNLQATGDTIDALLESGFEVTLLPGEHWPFTFDCELGRCSGAMTFFSTGKASGSLMDPSIALATTALPPD